MKQQKDKASLPEPTKSELEILQVLWKYGPNTVRFVNDTLNEEKREVQYASTLKLMQLMAEKGLLNRDDSQVKHIYSAAEEESRMKGKLLRKFVDNLFDGSASSLMQQLLGDKKASRKEMEEMKQLLDKLSND